MNGKQSSNMANNLGTHQGVARLVCLLSRERENVVCLKKNFHRHTIKRKLMRYTIVTPNTNKPIAN